jgi:hypothetical protein
MAGGCAGAFEEKQMLLTRRHVLTGLIAAPAIIKLIPLMKISPLYDELTLRQEQEAIDYIRGGMVRPYVQSEDRIHRIGQKTRQRVEVTFDAIINREPSWINR